MSRPKFESVPSEDSVRLISDSIDTIGRTNIGWVSDYALYHADRLALDMEWIRSKVKGGQRILEVGATPYFLTLAMKSAGLSVIAVDKLSEYSRKIIEETNLGVIDCDIETMPLPIESNSFDHVIFNEVFEHLRIDPIHTLREIYRVIKPDGRLWLSTPNLGSLKGITNLLFKNEAWAVVGGGVYEQYASLEKMGFVGHVREYTSREVSDFLKNIGFKVENVIYRDIYKNPIANVIGQLVPRMRRNFTVIAVK